MDYEDNAVSSKQQAKLRQHTKSKTEYSAVDLCESDTNIRL